ncbi:MAG: outer membrane lipoprotein-sorting protein [Elusimicrobia bacterium]|nr:outer membrane lipoprotein-sorting protein [Elusimicrobiota bacterium]
MKALLAALLLLAAASASAADVDVKELVDKANKALRGDSSRGRLTMTIETPDWKRSLEVEGWNKDRTFAFIVIRAPAKERGETTLRRRNEMWLWMPKVERVIKIPPTMMHSAWQGSDFTYEDIVKADSIVKDYTHKLLSTKKEEGRTVYHIEAIPKADAPVVWGKVITDVALYDSDQAVVPLNELDYSERGELIRTITLSDIKVMSGRRVPARLECVPAAKKGQRTVLQYQELEFDLPLKDDFFSYQRLQKAGS